MNLSINNTFLIGSIGFMLLLTFPCYAQPQQDTLTKRQNYSTIGVSVHYGLSLAKPFTIFTYHSEFARFVALGINLEHRFKNFSFCTKLQFAQFGSSKFTLKYDDIFSQKSVIYKHEDYEFYIGGKYCITDRKKKKEIINLGLFLTLGKSDYHVHSNYIQHDFSIFQRDDYSNNRSSKYLTFAVSISKAFVIGRKFIIEPQLIFNQMLWTARFPYLVVYSPREHETYFRYNSSSIGCIFKYRL